MALDKLTIIDGGGLSTTSDYRVGVITATKFVGPVEGSITATDASFSGNVSIAGTLTYEDVTNVDSVGIITARDGFKVLGGGANIVGVVTATGADINGDLDVDGHTNLDNVSVAGITTFNEDVTFLGTSSNASSNKIIFDKSNNQMRFFDSTKADFGQSGDLQIYHQSAVSYIDCTNNYPLHIQSNDLRIRKQDGNEEMITAAANGTVRLYYNGEEKLSTIDKGIKVGTGVTIETNGNSNFVGVSSLGTGATGAVYLYNPDADALSGTTNDIYGWKAKTYTEGLQVNSKLYLSRSGSNGLHLSYNNATGGTITQTVGFLNIQCPGGLPIYLNAYQHVLQAPDGKKRIVINNSNDMAVHLYHNDVLKFSTVSSGVNVVGTTTSTQLAVTGVSTFTGNIDANGDLDVDGHTNLDNVSVAGVSTFTGDVTLAEKIIHDGDTDTYLQFTTNTINLHSGGTTGLTVLDASVRVPTKLGINGAAPQTPLDVIANGSGYAMAIRGRSSDNTAELRFTSNDYGSLYGTIIGGPTYLKFATGGTNRWQMDSSGHLLPNTAGAVNIGSASAEIGDVYLASDKALKFGNSQIGDLYVGSDNVTYLRNSTGQMVIRAAGDIYISDYSGNHRAGFRNDNAVDLYFDIENNATPKLSTTATGISVHGEVAASQDYPNFRPVLDFNFAAEKKLDPRITYERTGPASFVNEFGKVVLVGDNAPRFDHDPDTRECKGLLIEETRTNQWLYSEDIATYITGGNLQQTTLANTTATTDPTGGTNAVLEAATASGGAHSFYKNFTSGSNGDNHTFSVWVKAAGVDYARIYVDTVGGNLGGPGVTFSTGNTWNVAASGVGTQVATSAVEYPNGWWRLSVTGSYSNRNDFYFHVDLEGGEGDISFTGNGSNGIYVWGVQAEAGAFPSSYIPTNGSTATRGADIVRIMDDEFKDIFGTEFKEFTIVADYDNSDTVDGSTQSLIDFWGESTGYTDRIEIFKDSHSPYHIEVRGIGNNNGLFANGVTSASSKAATQRFATSWSVDYSTSNAANRKWAFSFSGEAVDVIGDLTGTDVPALTRLGLGNTPTRLDFSPGKLHFKRFMFYPKAVSDNQLRTLSS